MKTGQKKGTKGWKGKYIGISFYLFRKLSRQNRTKRVENIGR